MNSLSKDLTLAVKEGAASGLETALHVVVALGATLVLAAVSRRTGAPCTVNLDLHEIAKGKRR